MLLSRPLTSGLLAALKNHTYTAVTHLAMPKRTATGSPSSSASTAAMGTSPARLSAQPPQKRRKITASAVPQTATAAPKTSQAALPAAGSKPAAGAAAKAAAPKPAASKVDENGMWMIVGLGNPGSNYDDTRHNIGFKVIDELAAAAGIDCRKLEKSAAVGKGELQGKQVLLVKPVTFMNNSGESVAALAKFYRVPPGRVLVVADDLDQPTAQVRLRQRGGHGGHNGLRSIIDRMGGTQDFPRIKIGIGRPSGPIPIASYVLQPFNKAERPEIDTAVQESIVMIKSVLALGLEKAASGQRV